LYQRGQHQESSNLAAIATSPWYPRLDTRRACVILTLADHFLTKRVRLAPFSTPPGGNQRRKEAALDLWASVMARESTPLWVWLTVALMAIGGVVYAATVFFIEYVLTFF